MSGARMLWVSCLVAGGSGLFGCSAAMSNEESFDEKAAPRLELEDLVDELRVKGAEPSRSEGVFAVCNDKRYSKVSPENAVFKRSATIHLAPLGSQPESNLGLKMDYVWNAGILQPKEGIPADQHSRIAPKVLNDQSGQFREIEFTQLSFVPKYQCENHVYGGVGTYRESKFVVRVKPEAVTNPQAFTDHADRYELVWAGSPAQANANHLHINPNNGYFLVNPYTESVWGVPVCNYDSLMLEKLTALPPAASDQTCPTP